ncbi:S-methyl-5-thioribose kinase [Mangrovibacillus cuniculi]|uniref:Methylthioribose kinase n=1 Tax=Mangrovibacillus cuniculi TaxID=2593652 RepID=A0A7S8HEU7_9BACI|nr:S-methyl-5-thioribose kinase [Mangrovibacillus cuniculi]QPC46133.1 S-methyl-5-thioribose kinase [Mangrovibacillus cuniculi]
MTIQITNHYQALTEIDAIQYALEKNLLEANQDYTCKEIGDGNLNLVFHITPTTGGTGIILKQALPYAKVVGESWPLTLERAYIEASALQWQATFVPTLVPKVFHIDKQLAITVLEDLSNLTILRTGLLNGNTYPKVGKDIGTFLAETLYHTSDYALHPFEKKKQVKRFSNPELCKITEDLVFTDPFFDSETNNFEVELKEQVESIWANDLLKLEVAKLKKQFLTETEALLHGDLHTGSVFVNENRTIVIDPEFAFYGPIGFDIGQVFANLLFAYLHHPEKIDRLQTLQEVWETYYQSFTDLWNKGTEDPYTKVEGYLPFTLTKHWEDALGFAGCEAIRRTIGLAHVADLDSIKNQNQRIHAKLVSLKIGQRLILERKSITSIQELLSLIHQEVSTV